MHESLADAVIELEIRIAYQDRTVAALDEIVRQLHARVDTLEAALRELRQANAAASPIGPANEPPPHY
jgi:uncharacterized coiled-coil protein SlyX